MRKNFTIRAFLYCVFPLIIILSGCSASSDVASDGLFQKRKHLKGFHFNGVGRSLNIQETGGSNPTTVPREIYGFQASTSASDFVPQKQEVNIELPRSSATSEVQIQGTQKRLNLRENLPATTSRYKVLTNLPTENRDEEEGKENIWNKKTFGWAALVLGVLSWALIAVFYFTPVLNELFFLATLVAYFLAAGGVFLGWESKEESVAGLIGFTLSLLYLIAQLIAKIVLVFLILTFWI